VKKYFAHKVWGLLVASMLALIPAPAGAASALMLTREELVRQSDLVVRVRAVDSISSWNG
jgi:hypothetical protein